MNLQTLIQLKQAIDELQTVITNVLPELPTKEFVQLCDSRSALYEKTRSFNYALKQLTDIEIEITE